MAKNDFAHLFDRLEAMTLGFGPVFREFNLQTTNYPPHNIIKQSDGVYVLELAVAGFKKSEIVVKEHQGELIIVGTKEKSPNETEGKDDLYQFRGIGRRDFEKKFKMAEFLEISDAKMEDGILSVTLVHTAIEEEQPRLIAIK